MPEVGVVEQDLAGVGCFECGGGFEQGGFSGAAFADHGLDGAGGDGEADVFQSGDGLIAKVVGFGDVFEGKRDIGHGVSGGIFGVEIRRLHGKGGR